MTKPTDGYLFETLYYHTASIGSVDTPLAAEASVREFEGCLAYHAESNI